MRARVSRRTGWLALFAVLAGAASVQSQESPQPSQSKQSPPSAAPLVRDALPDLFGQPIAAADLRTSLLATAIAAVQDSPAVSGEFTLERIHPKLPRPLQSRGQFLLVRGKGLQWHTLEPVEDQFVLRRDGSLSFGEGRKGQRPPQLGAVSDLLFSLFALDLEALERRFALHGAGSREDWQVGMKARDKATSRAVREAVVRGGEHVRAIDLVNGSGASIRIELRQVTVVRDLEPAQQAVFQ